MNHETADGLHTSNNDTTDADRALAEVFRELRISRAEAKRLRDGLDEINNHFDDQAFGPHDESQCAAALVNYAGAVLNGYELPLAQWWDEQDKSAYPYRPSA